MDQNFILWSRHRSNSDMLKLYFRSLGKRVSQPNDLGQMQTFLLFIGYMRSGHSMIGSLLDAHRQMVVSHELDVMKLVQKRFGAKAIMSLVQDNAHMFSKHGRDWNTYNYQVPNQWQGKHENVQVMGDKKGGICTLRIGQRPYLLDRFKRMMKSYAIKYLHIVRNPFDNITTMSIKHQYTLPDAIKVYFDLCQTNTKLIADHGDLVHTVRLEDFIACPQDQLKNICDFVDLPTEQNYLDDCASIVFASPKKTRQSIQWDQDAIKQVQDQIAQFAFLQGYSYES